MREAGRLLRTGRFETMDNGLAQLQACSLTWGVRFEVKKAHDKSYSSCHALRGTR